MTEVEWLSSDDPAAMLVAVLPTRSGDASPIQANGGQGGMSLRLLRLFAAESFRYLLNRHEPAMSAKQCRAIEALERLAEEDEEEGLYEAWRAANMPSTGIAIGTVAGTRMLAQLCVNYSLPDMLAYQCALLRELNGNLFRPVTLKWAAHHERPWSEDPEDRLLYGLVSRKMVPQTGGPDFPSEEWLAVDWLTPAVVALARAAYDGNPCPVSYPHLPHDYCDGIAFPRGGCLDTTRLVVLSDALEDAGCRDDDILMHLRGTDLVRVCPSCVDQAPDPETNVVECDRCECTGLIPDDDSEPVHVRGCWAVDLLLGKD